MHRLIAACLVAIRTARETGPREGQHIAGDILHGTACDAGLERLLRHVGA